ncbi:hypothetical protein Acor_67610 [Acrocarpospora corrugata]|uniref:GmrSD restriction endonucleases N-terminal domain-containing protein n=1 Tax=Acrocarpospora corrugata TaxID=35763 RepID=A0A5M3WBZ4_9ACTN|nr:DUF262 domain-containing protein [Acrocarpospora corrugata]GES04693.1 hypothetical protein Acor_67610 [Acrocarpospora corrugata]
MATVTRPRVEQTRPSQLVDWVLAGRVRIPAFQRSFRWERDDVIKLFDSVLRGFPIGNLLMWQRPAAPATLEVGPLVINAPETPDALWIVDGQQRITSLVGALTAPPDTVDPRFRIFYDPANDEFASASRRDRIPDDWLPVPVALSNVRLLAWQRERPWLSEDESVRCDSVVTAIRNYAIPMYVVESNDEKAIQTIFDRTNDSGKRLTRSEIFGALHTLSVQMEPSGLAALAASVRGFGFGEIPERVLVESVLAVRGGRIDFSEESKDDAERHAALRKTEQALGTAVEFLRDVAGIPHVRLLPHMLFLVIIARFSAVFGAPEGRAAELLRRWVWRGSVTGFAPHGDTEALRQNELAINDDPVAGAGRLLDLLQGGEWAADLKAVQIDMAQAKVNLLGLLSRRPRGLADISDGIIDAHTLMESGRNPLPRISPLDGNLTDTLANRFVQLPDSPSDSLSLLMNSGSFPQWERTLHSHVIDEPGVNLWRAGRYDEFFTRRAAQIRELIEGHVQENALFGFRDGPGLPQLGGDE